MQINNTTGEPKTSCNESSGKDPETADLTAVAAPISFFVSALADNPGIPIGIERGACIVGTAGKRLIPRIMICNTVREVNCVIYSTVKHPDWEKNPATKKVLQLKSAVNDMEQDVVRIDRQIEEHQKTIEKLAQEQKHVRNEIRRVDTLIGDLESGRMGAKQKALDEFQSAPQSYRRQKKPCAAKRTIRRSRK
jgi:hypothetical protein